MPAPAACYVVIAIILVTSVILVGSQDDETFGVLDYLDVNPLEVLDGNGSCPTDRLLKLHESCDFPAGAAPCIKLRCCPGYIQFKGRCYHSSMNPCNLNLCEQRCEVRGARALCTCNPGYRFHALNYQRRIQPYCIDIDECLDENGGCEQRCVNEPGARRCACVAPLALAPDGRRCEPAPPPPPPPPPAPLPVPILQQLSQSQQPLPLMRAASRCFAPCDAVTRLARRVRQLSEELLAAKTTLKHFMEHSAPSIEQRQNYLIINFTFSASHDASSSGKLLDSFAPIEGGFCRCERGPRGPPGPPGMEGPKGDMGPRGPRGSRGPDVSMDIIFLLINELKHDIRNIEKRVYSEGEEPDRFDIKKAWRHHKHTTQMEQARRTVQELTAYTPPPIVTTQEAVDVSPNGLTGEVTFDTETTDWRLKGETEPYDMYQGSTTDVEDQLRKLRLLANATDDEEDKEEGDYEYALY